jgi:hypothetical protein
MKKGRGAHIRFPAIGKVLPPCCQRRNCDPLLHSSGLREKLLGGDGHSGSSQIERNIPSKV